MAKKAVIRKKRGQAIGRAKGTRGGKANVRSHELAPPRTYLTE